MSEPSGRRAGMANDRNWGGRREGAGRRKRGWRIAPHRPRFMPQTSWTRVAVKLLPHIGIDARVRRAFWMEREKTLQRASSGYTKDVVFDEKKGQIRFDVLDRDPKGVSRTMHLFAI